MNNKQHALKVKERELLDKLVGLSHYNNIETREDLIKLLDSEIEELKRKELELISGDLKKLSETGFNKTLMAYARKFLERLAENMRSAGELATKLNEELQQVRSQLAKNETTNQNRSILDD